MSEIQLWTIPTNWQWATIADIGEVVSGGTPSTKNPSFWGGTVNWISPVDLGGYNNKFIFKGAKSLTETGLENSAAKLMPAGSIHFSSRAPIGYVVISKTNISTSQGFKSIVPAKGIFNEYVYYFLKSAKRIAEERASGTTFKELSGKAFSELPIPIPPVDEQHRIVEKIDELFSELDQGIDSLKTCGDHLKVYRQALLKQAFEGKLTEQWRNAHTDQLKTVEQLLTLIKEEREQHYQQQLEEWEEAVKTWEENGKQDKKPSKPQKLTHLLPLTKQELNKLPPLPKEWVWVRLSVVAENIQIGPFGSLLHQSDYIKNGVPLVNPSHIKNQRIEPDWNLSVTKQKLSELSSYIMRTGDIVIGRRGEMGRCAVVTEKENGFLCGTGSLFIRLLPNHNPNFYCYSLSSQRVKDFLSEKSIGTTMQNLNQEIIHNVPVPLCTFSEQQKIIEEVDREMTVLSEVKNTIEENLQKAEILRQSILEKAFSGQLVLQAPNDEPGSILLERIRAEREATPKPTRKPFTNKKKKEIDTVADLISVLESAHDWLSAQNVFRQCGIGDGAETETIETLYLELRDLVKEKRIEVERRGQEDWLRIFIVKE
jgi:type I restriction enzyme S subunit